MKNLDLNSVTSSSPNKQDNLSHVILDNRESQSSLSTHSSSSLECVEFEVKPDVVLKAHKPLARRSSNTALPLHSGIELEDSPCTSSHQDLHEKVKYVWL